MSAFQIGDRVLVSAEADDVYYGGEVVEGRVTNLDVASEDFQQYTDEERVGVEAIPTDADGTSGPLFQWVRPQDLQTIEEGN